MDSPGHANLHPSPGAELRRFQGNRYPFMGYVSGNDLLTKTNGVPLVSVIMIKNGVRLVASHTAYNSDLSMTELNEQGLV
jgi:hypothetical protein